MSIPVIENELSSLGNAGGINVSKPTGVVIGELLVVLVSIESASTTVQWDDSVTGWTFGFGFGGSTSATHIGMYWRIADGSEPTSVTIDAVNSSSDCIGWYLRISGADDTTPIDITGSSILQNSNGSLTIPSVTTTADNCLVLALVGSNSPDIIPTSTTTSGWIIENESTDSDKNSIAYASYRSGDPAATGSMQYDFDTAGRSAGVMFAIAGAEPTGLVPAIRTFTSETYSSNQTTNIVTKPSGVVAGDLLVLLVANDALAAGPQFADDITGFTFGWSEGNNSINAHIGMYWRIATGTEGVSETVTQVTGSDFIGYYIRISGANGITPIHQTGAVELSPTTSATPAGVTTTLGNCLILAHTGTRQGDQYPISVATANWTLVQDAQSGSSGGVNSAAGFASRSLVTAGASGSMTFDYSNNSSSTAIQFAISPLLASAAMMMGCNF